MAENYTRRVRKVLTTLLANGKEGAPTLVASIKDPIVAGEDIENIDTTLSIMAAQGHIDYVNDGNGNLSYTLKPSGTAVSNVLKERL